MVASQAESCTLMELSPLSKADSIIAPEGLLRNQRRTSVICHKMPLYSRLSPICRSAMQSHPPGKKPLLLISRDHGPDDAYSLCCSTGLVCREVSRTQRSTSTICVPSWSRLEVIPCILPPSLMIKPLTAAGLQALATTQTFESS